MKFAGIQVNTIKRWTRMLPHVAHKIFDSERFGRMLAQSSVCASSGIHTNVSSLLLILPAQIGSSSFFIFCFLSLLFLKPGRPLLLIGVQNESVRSGSFYKRTICYLIRFLKKLPFGFEHTYLKICVIN